MAKEMDEETEKKGEHNRTGAVGASTPKSAERLRHLVVPCEGVLSITLKSEGNGPEVATSPKTIDIDIY